MHLPHSLAAAGLAFLVLPLVEGSNTFAASNPDTGTKYENVREHVINAVWPRYPYIARLKAHDGFGTYKLTIDHETGHVVSVDIVKTTTHKELDDCAIKAFQQWRFRPHTEEVVLVPVTFTYANRKLSEARRLAVYAPDPPQPVTWHHGTGTFRFIVDYDTGKVTDVQIIKSTGRPSFDQGVVNTYRQWRFLPHKVHSIDTTVGFAP